MYRAIDLRRITVEQVPDMAHPGWYQWWAPVELCRQLLGPHAENVLPHLTVGTDDLSDYRLIYVGIAANESLYDRIVNWHIRERHTQSKLTHRTLSTLRQTLSSLAADSWAAEAETNAIIDQLRVEVFPGDTEIGETGVKQYLRAQEAEQIAQHVIPLNIQGNNNPYLHNFLIYLKGKRRDGRDQGLRDIRE